MSKNTGNIMLAFLAGAAAGALAGVLYAPDKGKNTRDRLSYLLDKYRNDLQGLIEELVNKKSEAVSEAKHEGDRVISDAIREAETLMGEVDALRNKISGSKS